MSTAKNLTGNKIYRMGSFAPTRGQNDPTGYIKRGLRNGASAEGTSTPQQVNNQGVYGGVSATGGDGESDTRAGIAQGILNGQQTAGPEVVVSQVPTATSGPLVITETGQMALNLPFNYQYAQGALQKKQETDTGLIGLSNQRQAQLQEYLRNKYNANKDYGITKLGALNNAAGRGIAFSSGYGRTVARNATDYNNLTQQLTEADQRSQNQYDVGRSTLQAQLQDYLRQQAVAQGTDLATYMGTLGFGK